MNSKPFREINSINTPTLYLITNDDSFAVLYQKLAIALATGVVSRVQIRRKHVPKPLLLKEIEVIYKLVQDYNGELIINDDIQVAKEFGLGVHLGQEDGSIAHARKLLGDKAIIGSTCHGSVALVHEAINAGASYAAMGAVFASSTKVNAKTVSFEQLTHGSSICHDAGIDFCVIGGMTAQNFSQLHGLNIDYVAVINDVLGVPIGDVESRCKLWQEAFDKYK